MNNADGHGAPWWTPTTCKDFEFAAHGFIATLADPVIKRADGPAGL